MAAAEWKDVPWHPNKAKFGPDDRLMFVLVLASRDQDGLRVAKEAIDALQAFVDGQSPTSPEGSGHTWVLDPRNDLVTNGDLDIDKLKAAGIQLLSMKVVEDLTKPQS